MACYGNVSSIRHIYGTSFYNTVQPIFLKQMPEVCTALRDLKMCPQTKFGIPMSNNIEFMLVTRFFLDLMAEVKVRYVTLRDPKKI